MAKPKLDEAAIWNGWDCELPGEGSKPKGSYSCYLAAYDGMGPLARVGFRSKAAAQAFALGNPAPRNGKEAGKFMKGL